MKKRSFAAVLAVALSGAVMMSGCTRSQMNYQIAEAIGTDGMYENNEPVETPKMAEKRKLLEESESEEATLQEYLSQAEALADRIRTEDLKAALVTDAGTPCISDPGNMVVAACAARGIPVIPVPGCSAGIAAVSISGFDAREFAFYGFLPREKKDLQNKLKEIGQGVRVAVLHESPYRIIALTEAIRETLPEARLTVCCDLTKLHEKTLYGTPDEVLQALAANEKTEKGEYCVVMDLHGVPEKDAEPAAVSGSVAARLADAIDSGLSLREAQEVLIRNGEKKNAVKQAALRLKKAVSE